MDLEQKAYAAQVAEAGIARDTDPESAMHQLESELERYEGIVSKLEAKLDPILSRYATVEAIEVPEAEPKSNLHGKIRRFERITNRLIDVMDRVAI